MQAQQSRTLNQSISQTQSLAAVQTLLRAGLGSITFLRNLLPEDNFSSSHFTTLDGSDHESSEWSLSQAEGSFESNSSRRSVNSFKTMTITRGYTDEGDKILNCLEHGIFDALEKRFLRSFIFGIYLDNNDPSNIVEAYTFNFKYHTIPGSDISFPVMSLVDGLTSSTRRKVEDPVTKAIKNGRPPTLKDVKNSVKTMLKMLIQAMHHMDLLPKRRFATFKVFYTEDTPPDYEPPNFQAGDIEKDRWYFMTHDLDEVPERCSIGKFDSGHHSVKLSVTSIASYLPSSTEHDNATFSGITSQPGRQALTPVQEADMRKDQVEKQLEDAENRNLVWAVDDLADEDADGEDDPDYMKDAHGHCIPVGVRNKNGEIETIPANEQAVEEHFSGLVEHIPKRLHEIVAQELPKDVQIDETQPLLWTPEQHYAGMSFKSLSKQPIYSPLSTAPTTPRPQDFDPEMLKNMSISTHDDAVMLDLETQVVAETSFATDLIDSFPHDVTQEDGIKSHEPDDNGLDCDCGISARCRTLLEDICCYCEGGCKKWFHVWCMGYHSIDDPRMPVKFICFECRMRSDITWDLIKLDLYPQMLLKFKDLTLFRRAIKVAQKEQKFTSLQFSTTFARGDMQLTSQMLKRLEDEELVLHESTSLDDMGLTVTSHSKKGKNKGKSTAKQPRPRRNMQKTRYVFNKNATSKALYVDCFSPDDKDVERRLLGVLELVDGNAKLMNLNNRELLYNQGQDTNGQQTDRTLLARRGDTDVVNETQTQEETQQIEKVQKRPAPVQDEIIGTNAIRLHKKIKVSLAIGVDLAE